MTLQSGGFIFLGSSKMTAQAGTVGGAISLIAPVNVLADSIINGLSGGLPVMVRIAGDLLLGQGSMILTDRPQVFPQVDLTGSLAPLAAPMGAVLPIPDICTPMLGVSDVSRFIVTVKGGWPPAPNGWQPDELDSGHGGTRLGAWN